MLFDSHTHLNLSPLFEDADSVVLASRSSGLTGLCVSAVCPGVDWSRVAELASRFNDFIKPQFGLHPCYIEAYESTSETQTSTPPLACLCCSEKPSAHTSNCLTCHVMNEDASEVAIRKLSELLRSALIQFPQASVGECGLDKRIKKQISLDMQEKYVIEHLKIAATYCRGITIHCVGAWGRLLALLMSCSTHVAVQTEEDDGGGNAVQTPPYLKFIILHSCNTMPLDMIQPFSQIPRLYFSLSGKNTVAEKVKK